MPTYFAAGVSLRLKTQDVPTTFIPDIGFDKGFKAQERLAAAEADRANGTRMLERPIDCLGEQGEGALKFLGRSLEVPFYCMSVQYERQSSPWTSRVDSTVSVPAEVRGSSSELSPAPSSSSSTAGQPLPKFKALRASTQAQAMTLPSPELPTTVDKAIPKAEKAGSSLTRRFQTVSIDPQPPLPHTSNSVKGISLELKLDPVKSFCRSKQMSLKDLKVDIYVNGTLANSTLIPVRSRMREEHAFSGK